MYQLNDCCVCVKETKNDVTGGLYPVAVLLRQGVLGFKILIQFIFAQVSQLTEYQSRIHLEIRRTQKLQWLSMIVTLLVGVALVYIFIQESQDFSGHMCFPEDRFHTSNI